MTTGVGGSTAAAELAAMKSMRGTVPPIGLDERLQRVARAQEMMRERGIDALFEPPARLAIAFPDEGCDPEPNQFEQRRFDGAPSALIGRVEPCHGIGP